MYGTEAPRTSAVVTHYNGKKYSSEDALEFYRRPTKSRIWRDFVEPTLSSLSFAQDDNPDRSDAWRKWGAVFYKNYARESATRNVRSIISAFEANLGPVELPISYIATGAKRRRV